MGSIVYQLDYWLNPSNSSKTANDGEPGQLSYDVFLGLSVLGGFLGLDHLYLRSPFTAFIKFIVNVSFFGVWWLYDALNAFLNRDIIKLFGVGIPGFGPFGIGAGCLSHGKPHTLHMNFFIYSFALGFGGIFGLDSYLVGDITSALFRFLFLISIIGAPIAILWWMYNGLTWLFLPNQVIDQYGGYFGKKDNGGGLIDWIVSILPQPLADAINGLRASVDILGKGVVKIPTKTAEAIKPFGDILKGAQGIDVTQACAKTSLENITKAATLEKPAQTGGALVSQNVLPYVLMGTIGIIAISGFILTYNRAKSKPKKDDSPPEPDNLKVVTEQSIDLMNTSVGP